MIGVLGLELDGDHLDFSYREPPLSDRPGMPLLVAIGDPVEMTFRRLFTADGIHNYFWKARPAR